MRYYVRIADLYTGRIVYEYDSTFSDTDEAIEDVRRMIVEGFLLSLEQPGFTVTVYDTHPDVPGVTAIRTETM